MRIILCILLLLITGRGINAQGYRLSIFQTENGLPTNLTRAVTQDRQGFIWIATDEGIARFDGRKFINFKKKLPGTRVKTVFRSRTGRLLVVTESGIVEIKQGQQNAQHKFTHPDSIQFDLLIANNTEDSTREHSPVNIYEDKQGNFWISEYNAVACYSKNRLKRFHFSTKYYRQSSLHAFNFVETEQGKLLLVTDKGFIFHYLAAKDSFALIDTGRLPLMRVGSLLSMDSGAIWIGDYNGIFEVKLDANMQLLSSRQVARLEAVSVLKKDNQGNVLIGTSFKGLLKMERHTSKPVPIDTFFFKVINAIFTDHEGGIWVSCDEGIALLQPSFFDKLNVKDQQTPHVQAIYPSGNRQLLVAEGSNLYTINTSNHHFNNHIIYRHEQADILSVIARNDTLFIGTDDQPSLYYLSNGKGYSLPLGAADQSVVSSYLDRDQHIWVAYHHAVPGKSKADTAGGLSCIGPGLKIRNYKAARGIRGKINVIKQAPDGSLYCGGEGAAYLYKYNRQKDSFEAINLSLPFKISEHFAINDICFDQKGRMWMGTSQGLLVLENGLLRLVNLGERFTQENIRAVYPAKSGRIWIGTNMGLIEYSPTQYFLFEEASGLPTKTISYRGLFEDKDETLWVATAGGLAYTQSKASEMRTTPLPVLLSLQVNKQVADMNKKLVIPYHAYLSCEFASLSYPGDKVLYQYRLRNKQEQWSAPTHEPQLYLPALEDGSYVLEIRAQQQGNYRWSNPLVLAFEVSNAWYRTTWALLAYILGGVFLLSVVVKLNTERLNIQKRKLEHLVWLRTFELEQQRDETERQKLEIEKQNQEIKASLLYSKRIQDAMLPDLRQLRAVLPDTFIFYQPRDIVSGDFYWFAQKDNKYLLAAVDCTGHGVPGALMSMIGHDKLRQIVDEKNTTEPSLILSELDKSIIASLQQQHSDAFSHDGMDIALVVIDKEAAVIEFAAARHVMYYFVRGEFHELKGNKYSIGSNEERHEKHFSTHRLSYEPGLFTFYLFSDGFKDQFGGSRDTKYTSRRFRFLLSQIYQLPAELQLAILRDEFVNWKGKQEQTDDVLVVGVKL